MLCSDQSLLPRAALRRLCRDVGTSAGPSTLQALEQRVCHDCRWVLRLSMAAALTQRLSRITPEHVLTAARIARAWASVPLEDLSKLEPLCLSSAPIYACNPGAPAGLARKPTVAHLEIPRRNFWRWARTHGGNKFNVMQWPEATRALVQAYMEMEWLRHAQDFHVDTSRRRRKGNIDQKGNKEVLDNEPVHDLTRAPRHQSLSDFPGSVTLASVEFTKRDHASQQTHSYHTHLAQSSQSASQAEMSFAESAASVTHASSIVNDTHATNVPSIKNVPSQGLLSLWAHNHFLASQTQIDRVQQWLYLLQLCSVMFVHFPARLTGHFMTPFLALLWDNESLQTSVETSVKTSVKTSPSLKTEEVTLPPSQTPLLRFVLLALTVALPQLSVCESAAAAFLTTILPPPPATPPGHTVPKESEGTAGPWDCPPQSEGAATVQRRVETACLD